MGGLTGPVNSNKVIEDFHQGNRQDCGLLSTVKAISLTEKGAQLIEKSIFSDSDSGIIGAKFYNGDTFTITNSTLEEGRQYKGDGQGQKVYSFGDDDVTLIEMTMEEAFKNSKDPILRDIVDNYATRFVPEGKDDMLYGVDPASVTYLLTGEKCETVIKHSDRPATTFVPMASYSVQDTNGNMVELTSGTKYRLDKTQNSLVLVNPETGEQYNFSSKTVMNFFAQDAKASAQRALELLTNKDDDDVLVFATADQEILNDINGNRVDIGGAHAFAVEKVEDGIVTLIDPNKTEDKKEVYIDELMNLENFYLYYLDLPTDEKESSI